MLVSRSSPGGRGETEEKEKRVNTDQRRRTLTGHTAEREKKRKCFSFFSSYSSLFLPLCEGQKYNKSPGTVSRRAEGIHRHCGPTLRVYRGVFSLLDGGSTYTYLHAHVRLQCRHAKDCLEEERHSSRTSCSILSEEMPLNEIERKRLGRKRRGTN